MRGKPGKEKDRDPALNQEFFIGGWDPYVVELTRLKRDKPEDSGIHRVLDRRDCQDRRITRDRRED